MGYYYLPPGIAPEPKPLALCHGILLLPTTRYKPRSSAGPVPSPGLLHHSFLCLSCQCLKYIIWQYGDSLTELKMLYCPPSLHGGWWRMEGYVCYCRCLSIAGLSNKVDQQYRSSTASVRHSGALHPESRYCRILLQPWGVRSLLATTTRLCLALLLPAAAHPPR